jgi:SAM-dependent methyltransferase
MTMRQNLSPDQAAPAAASLDACEVCGEHRFVRGAVGPLARCRECGYLWYPEPPGSTPRELYQEAYFLQGEYLDYQAQQRTLAKNFRRYLRLMRRFGASAGRLLEVGCAYGFFLAEARGRFDVEGAEICAEAAAQARRQFGFRISSGEFPALQPSGLYDVVCLWDTVEHLVHPRAYLRKAYEVLQPGGALFLTTGDIGSLAARLQGPRWRLIHPPTHLHYFSNATMTRLLTDLGFRVEGIVKVGVHRELAAMLHGLSLFSTHPVIRRLTETLVEPARRYGAHLDLYLNLYDIMFVAARKPA